MSNNEKPFLTQLWLDVFSKGCHCSVRCQYVYGDKYIECPYAQIVDDHNSNAFFCKYEVQGQCNHIKSLKWALERAIPDLTARLDDLTNKYITTSDGATNESRD